MPFFLSLTAAGFKTIVLEPNSSIPDISNEKQDLRGLRGAEPDESSAPLFATNFFFFLSVVLINRKKGGIFSVKEGFSKRGVLKEPQRLKKGGRRNRTAWQKPPAFAWLVFNRLSTSGL
jgi:hypothetical protein